MSELKVFLTEYRRGGRLYAGPRIPAYTWHDAEAIAGRLGLRVVGELVEEVEP